MSAAVPKNLNNPYPSGQDADSAVRQARTFYVEFLQYIFGRRPRGGFHWDRDPHQSEIVITVESPIRLETMTDRPCVSVARGPMAFTHLGWDDMEERARSGRRRKVCLLQGTMILNVCSRNALESEDLAYMAASSFLSNRDLLQRRGFLDVGQNMGVGATSAAGSLIENDRGEGIVATSVTSPFYLPWYADVTPLNQPILRSIDLEIQSPGCESTGRPVHQLQPQPGVPQGFLPPEESPVTKTCVVFRPSSVQRKKFGGVPIQQAAVPRCCGKAPKTSKFGV